MDIGITGLGRMGAGMAERWVRAGHRVVVNNRSHGPIEELAAKGAVPAYSLEELVDKLAAPRAIWIMLPAGDVTERAIEKLIPLLSPGDTIIDAGNTNFNDDIRRAAMLKEHDLNYIDQGTSGGFLGAQEARRENGEIGSHGWGLRELREGRWRSAADEGHDGEAGPAGCRAKAGGMKSPTGYSAGAVSPAGDAGARCDSRPRSWRAHPAAGI